MRTPIIDELRRLFSSHGNQHYGESVSQLDHALQCAALVARDGGGDALVAAALLHDIGHLLVLDRVPDAPTTPEPDVDFRHEELGAAWLANHFGAAVTEPIRLHVAAKRWLHTRDPSFSESLSEASRLSLQVQGGRLSEQKRLEFEANPFATDAVTLRRAGDAGKVEGLDCGALEDWLGLVERVVERVVKEPGSGLSG